MGCGAEAAAGSGTRVCPIHVGICSGHLRRENVLKVVRRQGPKWALECLLDRKGGSENLIWPKSFFSLSGYRGREACLGRVGAGPSQREAQLCPAAHRSPAPVPHSLASPAEPTQGRWSSRRLTCQALRSYPISCGRRAAAAMFSASRCQSLWRWPMGGRAGGQVIAGQLAPHWCALPSLLLRLRARSD